MERTERQLAWSRGVAAIVALLILVATAEPAKAAGSSRGQVVDAETHEPVGGVYVLAVWYRRTEHMVPGYGRTGFFTLA